MAPSEAMETHFNTSTKMLHKLFGKNWEMDKLPDDWKEFYLIKLLKKGELKKCKNWIGIKLLVDGEDSGSCYVIFASQGNTPSSYRRPMSSAPIESLPTEFFLN